ncbi:hypothetical protein [Streptomyces bauhiniae]
MSSAKTMSSARLGNPAMWISGVGGLWIVENLRPPVTILRSFMDFISVRS